MLQLDPLVLTLSTSARAASAPVVEEAESELELVPDSEPDSEVELGLVLPVLVSPVAEVPEELGVSEGELSLLGVVVVTGSLREQPESAVRGSDRSGINSASARPATENRGMGADT